jgi:hypothetical protein
MLSAGNPEASSRRSWHCGVFVGLLSCMSQGADEPLKNNMTIYVVHQVY